MSEPQPTPPKHGNGSRYIALLLVGLLIGAIGTVMVLRSIEGSKTWQDHYPYATMHLLQAHMAQLGANADANRCATTDSLPHLQSLRSLANNVEPAFPGLRDDNRFIEAAGGLRGALDRALAAPPASCEALAEVRSSIGETCKACHQTFR